VQAGLPLFGHELEGALGLSLTEAGYGFVPKFHKPFFIGRAAYIKRTNTLGRKIIRLKTQGRKTVRQGHTILDESGRAVGTVTSSAFTDEEFNCYVLAAVEPSFKPAPGAEVKAVRTAFDQYSPPADEKSIVILSALERFPPDEEALFEK
jgi:glycine cleavage system aminomethyltransferase T